jgi:hypothetical protein
MVKKFLKYQPGNSCQVPDPYLEEFLEKNPDKPQACPEEN